MWAIVTFYLICLYVAQMFTKTVISFYNVKKRPLLLEKNVFFKDHCFNSSWPFKNISSLTTSHKSGTLTDIPLGPDHQLRFIHKNCSSHFGFFPVNSHWLLAAPWSTETPPWLMCSPCHAVLLPVVSYPWNLNSFHSLFLPDWFNSRAQMHSSPHPSTSLGTQ